MATTPKPISQMLEKTTLVDDDLFEIVDSAETNLSRKNKKAKFANIKTAIGGVEEAPEDGTTYGRKDAAWVNVAGAEKQTWSPQLVNTTYTGYTAYGTYSKAGDTITISIRFEVGATAATDEFRLGNLPYGVSQASTAVALYSVDAYSATIQTTRKAHIQSNQDYIKLWDESTTSYLTITNVSSEILYINITYISD